MLETPKDLPPLTPPAAPPKGIIRPAIPEKESLSVKTETAQQDPRLNLSFPVIEIPKSSEIIISPTKNTQNTLKPLERKTSIVPEDEFPSFDEAIKSIHRDIMNITSEEPKQEKHSNKPRHDPENHDSAEEAYYAPKNLGEGYFSEIKHYLKNKDSKEIVEDILKKDFLTGMKDYHEHKAQGKPYYLHKKDLEDKLELKMQAMMAKEEEWHELKSRIELEESKKHKLEREIDSEAQELKALFKQIKTSQLLEKEAAAGTEFSLKSGQKLKSLNDLRKALSYMPDEEFKHHSNEQRNDFSEWAKHTLQLPEIAEKIKNARTKQELSTALSNLA